MYPPGFTNSAVYDNNMLSSGQFMSTEYNNNPDNSGYLRLGNSWTPTENTHRDADRDKFYNSYQYMSDRAIGVL